MQISAWVDTPFGDDDAFADFQFVLSRALDRVAVVMLQAGNPVVTYPIADARKDDRDWLLDLQVEMQSMYNLNHLTGLPDFASSNLDKEDEYSDFMFLLSQSVATLNTQLGIT